MQVHGKNIETLQVEDEAGLTLLQNKKRTSEGSAIVLKLQQHEPKSWHRLQ